MANHVIFVYGSLKSGQPNSHLLESCKNGLARLLGNARTVDRWPLVVGGELNIPYLLFCKDSPSAKHITGEVYEVDDDMLKVCDKLEGHPDYYERDFISLQPEPGMLDSLSLHDRNVYAYFLKKYNPVLMDLPFISCYDSFTAPKKFVIVADRTPTQSTEQRRFVMATK